MATILLPQGETFLDQTVGAGETVVEGEEITLDLGTLAGTMRVTQDSRFEFTSYWNLDTPVAVDLFRSDVEIDFVASFPSNQVYFTDVYEDATPGTIIEYIIFDQQTASFISAEILVRNPDIPFTYGSVDPLVDVIRYGSLDSVKQRLGFNDAKWDVALTQAMIAGEVAIDIGLGRSFPDSGGNPQVIGVPEQIKQASENIAVKIFKMLDAPFGTAGSEGFLGELDLTEIVRREIMFNPLLGGYQVAWGVA